MSRIVLWLPKQILFSHYVLFLNLITPQRRMKETERQIERMHHRLFGDAQK